MQQQRRTTYDIQDAWECVVSHVDWTNVYAEFAGPGGFNDMDILEVGNSGDPWDSGNTGAPTRVCSSIMSGEH